MFDVPCSNQGVPVNKLELLLPMFHVPIFHVKLSDLDASRLCQLTFRTLEQLVAKWNTEIPEQWKDVCSNHPHTISHFAIKNTRRKMEDRHCIAPSMSLFTDNEVRSQMLYTSMVKVLLIGTGMVRM